MINFLLHNTMTFLNKIPKFSTATQVVAQAIVAQKLQDKQLYTSDFKEKVQGKGPKNADNSAYPENARARKCAKILSQVIYI